MELPYLYHTYIYIYIFPSPGGSYGLRCALLELCERAGSRQAPSGKAVGTDGLTKQLSWQKGST